MRIRRFGPAPTSTVLARVIVDATGERYSVELVALPRLATVGDLYEAELPRRLGFPLTLVPGAATVTVDEVRYPFRNGWARLAIAEFPPGTPAKLIIRPESSKTAP